MNVLTCLQRTCHLYRREKDPGGMLIQVGCFSIFGKHGQGHITNAHEPILHPPQETGGVTLVFA